jgi:hypothetical protein
MRIAIIPAIAAFGAAAFIAVAGLTLATVFATAWPARADANQDQEFYRLLTRPDQDHPMAIWNFPEARSWGIQACQRQDAGETPYQATKDLQYPNGPYTFDDANSVSSAADTIYCPWHGTGSEPGWADSSTPVFPQPGYPPLAWYPPPPVYYPPPGGGY